MGAPTNADRLRDATRERAARQGVTLDGEQDALIERLATFGAMALTRHTAQLGLFVWGPAGRGKSMLADAFFETLPTTRKTRVHFHRFFDELHRGIHEYRDEHDALRRAVARLTSRSQLLLFDELHVHDSGDARLLTQLLDYVFEQDIPVLATSNYSPDGLLPNPIWHHTFEPGIALIRAHMDVYHLDGPTDYRAHQGDHSDGFASGSWVTSRSAGRQIGAEEAVLTVRGRRFPVQSASAGALEATFAQLCEAPTSTIEYLEWVRRFSSWTITDVPVFTNASPDAQQRFINLIDVLVDADVPLTLVSDRSLADFLDSSAGRPDAFRMTSRLQLLQQDVSA